MMLIGLDKSGQKSDIYHTARQERRKPKGEIQIYQILPQLIELWGLNVQTEVESRKNLAKVSGK